ncbi:MAG: hypothetical protein Q7U07_05130 [Gammaproteobacteria bacterium]|nr:hypothetical protein [Gammaproteobacteria bacterium]
MQPVHEVVGHFMRHGVSQVVIEIGREHPRVVADHALPGYRVPAELAGGQPAQVEPDLNRGKFTLINSSAVQDTVVCPRDNELLLAAIEGAHAAMSTGVLF